MSISVNGKIICRKMTKKNVVFPTFFIAVYVKQIVDDT